MFCLLTYLLTYLLHNKSFATLSFAIDRHVHRFSIPEITENMPAFLINLSVISRVICLYPLLS